uniref:Protein kinase domain-containing protein n=1 Tax=Panagrolaimus superbus TaxID=310955 RepID=A0A914Y086_9BILA
MDTGSEWFLRSTNLRTVYMVGFGTCVKKKVALEKNERRFVNLTFGSRKSHNLTHVLDKNDDIESWLFLAIELFKRGSLPWRRKTSHAEILIMKQKFFEEIGCNLSNVKTNANTGHALAEQKFNGKIFDFYINSIYGKPFDANEFIKYCDVSIFLLF